jgi:hypothetical protein
MKKVVWTLGVLGLSAGLALAQDKPVPAKPAAAHAAGAADHAALDKALIANEHKILEAIAKHDKAAFGALMAPGSMAADETGFMTTESFVPMMDQVDMPTWKTSDEKALWVDPNTAILTYTWTGTGSMQGQPFKSPTYASTVWTKKSGKWLVVYHQETVAAAKK